jgi:hypothetical protein
MNNQFPNAGHGMSVYCFVHGLEYCLMDPELLRSRDRLFIYYTILVLGMNLILPVKTEEAGKHIIMGSMLTTMRPYLITMMMHISMNVGRLLHQLFIMENCRLMKVQEGTMITKILITRMNDRYRAVIYTVRV